MGKGKDGIAAKRLRVESYMKGWRGLLTVSTRRLPKMREVRVLGRYALWAGSAAEGAILGRIGRT